MFNFKVNKQSTETTCAVEEGRYVTEVDPHKLFNFFFFQLPNSQHIFHFESQQRLIYP